jgi:hypothetical protein
MFIKFSQLYYNKFITNRLDIMQNCPDPQFSAQPIFEALTNILTGFRLAPVNWFKREITSQFLQHFFLKSDLFDTTQIRSPADPRC